MRIVKSPQMQIGQTDIADIIIDVTSRDDIPMILLGLQHIYTTLPLRKAVFKILEEVIPHKEADETVNLVAVDANKGRPGMDQWCILVLGTLRLGSGADYDRIQELANQHRTLRMMLGHGLFTTDKDYRLQTLKDNLALFTPEIMARINVEVIRAGYQLLDLDIHSLIRGRCDSFVLKTDVHFPTDITLLYDAIRVLIRDCVYWSKDYALPEWRQHQCNLRRFKALYRKIQKLRHSTSKDESKKRGKEVKICDAHQAYIDLAQFYLNRVARSVELLKNTHKVPGVLLADLSIFSQHVDRQIDQIKRRVIEGEKIPHAEWISKGKAGVPVELGIRMCIMEDNHGFILHHRVMKKETDDKIALEMVNATQVNFPSFNACSFDKGFHSLENQRQLKDKLKQVVLPKKGRLSSADKVREYDEEFVQAKKKHSAVESAINALQVHGLNKCPDQGIEGFERYAALAVLSRNIQRIGCIIRDRERKKLEEKKYAA